MGRAAMIAHSYLVTPQYFPVERDTARDSKITFEPPRAPEPGSSPPAPPMGVGANARPVSTPTHGRKYYNTVYGGVVTFEASIGT